jgi:hypothetical protein
MPAATFTMSVAASSAPSPASVAVTYGNIGGTPRLELTGVETYAIDLAMMPAAGIKGLYITMDTTDAAGATVSTPITIRRVVGGVTINEPLGPGDAFAFTNAGVTSGGTTALTLISAANAVVHIYAIG